MELKDHIRAGAPTCRLTIRGQAHDVAELMDDGHALVEQACERAGSGIVATVLANSADSAQVVLGAISAERPLVSLPSRPGGQPVDAYADALLDLLLVCGDTALIGLPEEELAAVTARTAARAEVERPSPRLSAIDDFALVQFTSGTTGTPRGVLVGPDHLIGSIEATLERLGAAPGDGTCSWLPLSHDMGLVGMFLTPLVASSPSFVGEAGCDLLTPTEFLRKPLRWLERIEQTSATITAAPDSALRHLVRTNRGGPAIDLSRLKALIVGGEVNRPSTMAEVTEVLRSFGAGPGALCPAYGMAEAGLAVSITPPGEGFTVIQAPFPGEEQDHDWVAAGPPLSGYEVRASPGEGVLRVAGPGLATSYLDGERLVDEDGFYETSDVGMVAADGAVVVMGRIDDTLVLNGRNIPAGSVDRVLHDSPGVRANRAYACMLMDGSWAVVAELRVEPDQSHDDLLRELRRRATAATGASPDVVLAARASSIPFTTSGKLRRSELGRMVSTGTIPGVARI